MSYDYELEIARFGVRAPRAGTVDVKRLICIRNMRHEVTIYVCCKYKGKAEVQMFELLLLLHKILLFGDFEYSNI